MKSLKLHTLLEENFIILPKINWCLSLALQIGKSPGLFSHTTPHFQGRFKTIHSNLRDKHLGKKRDEGGKAKSDRSDQQTDRSQVSSQHGTYPLASFIVRLSPFVIVHIINKSTVYPSIRFLNRAKQERTWKTSGVTRYDILLAAAVLIARYWLHFDFDSVRSIRVLEPIVFAICRYWDWDCLSLPGSWVSDCCRR